MLNAPSTPRSLLTRRVDGTTLKPMLAAAADFRPYPPISDRTAWDGLPATLRRELIASGEAHHPQP